MLEIPAAGETCVRSVRIIIDCVNFRNQPTAPTDITALLKVMPMIYKKIPLNRNSETADSSAYQLTTPCPWCGGHNTFNNIKDCKDIKAHYVENNSNFNFLFGIRSCPNPDCEGYVFFNYEQNRELLIFPHPQLDFRKDDIPQKLVDLFEETITCHSTGCYTSAAIMIRRTLEELCDLNKCTGKNLKERIQKLRSQITLPNELFNALDELRILGNDAAHINSKDYDDIGRDEVETGIELTKEVLKSLYQYESLVNKLKSLKKKIQQP